MNPVYIGFDTSCYATSAACVSRDGIIFQNKTMLPVASGERGLRQADGVFLHVRELERLSSSLFQAIRSHKVAAIAVSATPTDAPDSYMPVFLAGVASAAAAAEALHVPLVKTSHQRGHIRAALMDHEELMQKELFFALHLSGGTTDLLEVRTRNGRLSAIERVGGSDDLHIGQFVDRVGVRLGLPFPAGAQLEELAMRAQRMDVKIPASVRGAHCSFSGPETQAQRLMDNGMDRAELAYGVYDCMARTIGRLIGNVHAEDVLLCGGVSGSALLLKLLAGRTHASLRISRRGLSGDNAVGTALLGMDAWEEGL